MMISEPANWTNLIAACALLAVLCAVLWIAARANPASSGTDDQAEPTGRNEWTTFPTNDVMSVLPLVAFIVYVAGVGVMVAIK